MLGTVQIPRVVLVRAELVSAVVVYRGGGGLVIAGV